MYGTHSANRIIFTKDSYSYLSKLSVRLNEEIVTNHDKNDNLYTECIQSIMSGQDVENIEEFQTIFEEVGELVNIPYVVDDVLEYEDINPPHCESEYKKAHNLSMVDIFKKGRRKLIEYKVTELRLSKKKEWKGQISFMIN